MTLPAPTYDLMLVLDPEAADDARAKIVADARAAISADGELLRHDEWGQRPLAFPIERRASGEYHLMQFHAGRAELLHGLDRNLRIADGILRFRIIRLAPGVPDPPDMRSAAAAPRPAEGTPAPDAPPSAAPADQPAPEAPAAAEAQPEAPPTSAPDAAAPTPPEPGAATAAEAPAAAPPAAAEPDAASAAEPASPEPPTSDGDEGATDDAT